VLGVAVASTQSEHKVTTLHLRLSIPESRLKLGSPIPVRIELFNSGLNDSFIGKYFSSSVSNPSYLLVSVRDSTGRESPFQVWSEYLTSQAAAEWWVPVPPRHYYGAELTISSETHAFLRKPGKYCVVARYVSQGGQAPVAPRQVWKGELESNSVCIQILPAGEAEKPTS
jgi:hypothetical protein